MEPAAAMPGAPATRPWPWQQRRWWVSNVRNRTGSEFQSTTRGRHASRESAQRRSATTRRAWLLAAGQGDGSGGKPTRRMRVARARGVTKRQPHTTRSSKVAGRDKRRADRKAMADGDGPLTRRVWAGCAPTQTRARRRPPALWGNQSHARSRCTAARRMAGALTKEIPPCQFWPRVSCVEMGSVQSRRREDRNGDSYGCVRASERTATTKSARAVDPSTGGPRLERGGPCWPHLKPDFAQSPRFIRGLLGRGPR